MRSKIRLLSLCALALSWQGTTLAANPDQPWLTRETDHFTVHYPDGYQAWAEMALNQFEATRELIKQQQQRIIEAPIEIIIDDPLNTANGSALPLVSRPTIRLHTTPPQSDAIIGNLNSWPRILILHEYVHLIHLAQRSRNDIASRVGRWWDLYEAATIPGERWVAEGYATLLESRLTGRGRIHADNAEAFIRQLVREGAMPAYQELNLSKGRYQAGAMAYLVGSRFLLWLEQEYGEAQLDAVWTRWKAVKRRNFNSAFRGVFGQSPAKLYRRFVAQLTHRVLAQTPESTPDPAITPWLDATGALSAPALSSDGKHLALAATNNQGERSLVVYDTADNLKAKERFEKAQQKVLEADPADIADRPPAVFKRKLAFELDSRHFDAMDNVRWLPGAERVLLFTARVRDSKGDRHLDLYRWDLDSDRVTRLTHNANLRRFDISSDGRQVIAEQNRHGFSRLIRLALDSGDISPLDAGGQLTGETPETIFDMPRISPDQRRLAYLVHRLDHHWQLRVRELDGSRDIAVPLPEGYQFVSYPTWHQEGRQLVFAAGVDGQLSLYSYHLEDRQLVRLTDTTAPVAWPVSLPNGDKGGADSLLFLQQDSEGMDVYHLATDQTARHQAVSLTTHQAAATSQPQINPLLASTQSKTGSEDTSPERPYGLGRTRATFTLGTLYNQATGTNQWELGARGNDILRRLDWQVGFSDDSDGQVQGANGYLRWRGAPVQLTANLFDLRLSPDNQAGSTEQGLRLTARWPWQTDNGAGSLLASYHSGEINGQLDQYWQVGLGQSWYIARNDFKWRQLAKLSWLDGRLGDDDWRGVKGRVAADIELFDVEFSLAADWQKRLDADVALLSLGGYASTLVSRHHNDNRLLDPLLPFATARTNSYRRWGLSTPLGDYGRIFYRRHELDNSDDYQIFGVGAATELDFGFSGVNDLRLDIGAGRVKPDHQSGDTRVWAGLYYNW